MRRKRILRDRQQASEVAGRKAVGFVSDQRPEGLQTGRLRKRGERHDGGFGLHISRFMEITDERQSGLGSCEFGTDLRPTRVDETGAFLVAPGLLRFARNDGVGFPLPSPRHCEARLRRSNPVFQRRMRGRTVFEINTLTNCFFLGVGAPRNLAISNVLEIQLTAGDDGVHDRHMKIDDAAARLEALGSPTRLRIYRALVRAGHAGMAVGRLQERLKIPASTLSHHIKALVSVGLVSQLRQGTTLFCHVEYDVMRTLVDFLVAECCADEAECKSNLTAA